MIGCVLGTVLAGSDALRASPPVGPETNVFYNQAITAHRKGAFERTRASAQQAIAEFQRLSNNPVRVGEMLYLLGEVELRLALQGHGLARRRSAQAALKLFQQSQEYARNLVNLDGQLHPENKDKRDNGIVEEEDRRERDQLAAQTIVIRERVLTVQKQGPGRFVSSPRGMDCGVGCTQIDWHFAVGQRLTLETRSRAGSSFLGWSGSQACSGTGPCSLLLTEDIQITARFRPLYRNPWLWSTLAFGAAGLTIGLLCKYHPWDPDPRLIRDVPGP